MIAVDIAGAFDRVSHVGLLIKAQYAGIGYNLPDVVLQNTQRLKNHGFDLLPAFPVFRLHVGHAF